MKRAIIWIGLLLVTLFVAYEYFGISSHGTVTQKSPVPVPAKELAAADAHSLAIVAAANGFLATLNDTQKKAAIFEFKNAVQRVNWSNFPLGGPGADRKGLRWGDLNDAQRKTLLGLLGAILSPKGVLMVRAQVAADDFVAAEDAKTKTASWFNILPKVSFGSAYYFVAFVGAPSATVPWMLQFGGHHLAMNATVVGRNVTLSPSLTGGQPQRFTFDGKPIYIDEEEATRAAALLNSLTEAQRVKAVVSNSRTSLVLGPGQDGLAMQPEGLAGAGMTEAQKALLVSLIESRLGMLNADDLVPKMADVRANLDKTYFGWWGPATPVGAAYFRVTGPTVQLEFSPESNDGDATDHVHAMYRDPTNEYGAAWTALQ